MENTSKQLRRLTIGGLLLLTTFSASTMVGGIYLGSFNFGISIGGFSISIPSIRIPDYRAFPGNWGLYVDYWLAVDLEKRYGINYFCQEPVYREPAARQFQAEIDCIIAAIKERKGKSKTNNKHSKVLAEIARTDGPHIRVFTPEVAARYNTDYDKWGGIEVSGNIYLKPGHGYAYLHELLHYTDIKIKGPHHPNELNEQDRDFWIKTEFGKKLSKAHRDIFGYEHPMKERVMFPSKPRSRIKVSPCFAGLKSRL